MIMIGFVNAQRDTIHISHFPNGNISTFSYLEKDQIGKAIAYNLKGEIIYEKNIRRIYGNASVRFSHYENGALKKAHYTSYPDGGIQWFKSTTFYNKKGEVISETTESNDVFGSAITP
jgi:hypothetical protein